jgi:cytochrome c5
MRSVRSGLAYTCSLVLIAIAAVEAQNPGGDAAARKVPNPVKSSPASIAAGQTVYQKNCRFCHGPEAKGDGTGAPKDTHPSDLTDAKWERGARDGEIFAVLCDGAGPDFKMRGDKGRIPDQDRCHVVNYLRSVGPNKYQ